MASKSVVTIPIRWAVPGAFALGGWANHSASATLGESSGIGAWDKLGYLLFDKIPTQGGSGALVAAGGYAGVTAAAPVQAGGTTLVVNAGGPAARSWDLSNISILGGAATVCGVAVVVLYLTGHGLDDVFWVTKATFRATHKVLSAAVEGLKGQLDTVKQDLLLRIGFVEDKVDECRVSIESKVELEVGQVRHEVGCVGSSVDAVRRKQEESAAVIDRIESQVSLLDRKVDSVHGRLGKSEHMQRQCTRGTVLLCKRVTSLGSGALDPEQRELERFVVELDPSWSGPSSSRSAPLPVTSGLQSKDSSSMLQQLLMGATGVKPRLASGLGPEDTTP